MVDKCRLCAKPSRSLESVFSFVESGRLLLDLIYIVCPIKIDMSDDLPKQVCEECREIIITSVQLRELSVKSDLTFRMKDLENFDAPSTFTSLMIKQELDDEWDSSEYEANLTDLQDPSYDEPNPLRVDSKRKKYRGKPSSSRYRRTSHDDNFDIKDDYSDRKPPSKKKKLSSNVARKALEHDEIVQRILRGVNVILTNFKYDEDKYGQPTTEHVEVAEKDGKMECSVRCLFCNESRKLSENDKGNVVVGNYKQHLNKIHVKAGDITRNLKQEEGSMDGYQDWSLDRKEKRQSKSESDMKQEAQESSSLE